MKISQNFSQDFKYVFQLLANKFPKLPPESPEFQPWWQQNEESWTEEFWSIMEEYRNMSRNWYVNEVEKALLKRYESANKLLISCLYCDCNLTDTTRKEIEKTFLLPIAEIEKRKQLNN